MKMNLLCKSRTLKSNCKVNTETTELDEKPPESTNNVLSRSENFKQYDMRVSCPLSPPNTSHKIKSIDKQRKENGDTTSTKVLILNKVLQSPWNPKSPVNYRPSHNKPQDLSEDIQNSVKHISLKDRNNSPDQLLSVQICDETYDSLNNNAKETYTQDKPQPKYKCMDCHKSFSQLRNFKYHMSIHRGTKEFATTCPICDKQFNDKGYLSSHMKIHRNRKEYKCSMCPKSFNQRVAYNMHMNVHTGIKPHVCEECGKAFSRKMLLKQHRRTHSGERPYACTHCDKRFADRSNMTLHLKLHTGIKPFVCQFCSKSFTKKHHLKSHLNFHTGVKPYACPNCSLAFTQSSNMRTHLKKCWVSLPFLK